MAAYYQNRRMPLRPACGLHEDDTIEPQRKPQKEVPSFPLSVFPTAIHNIVEALVGYEHFNVNFIAASMFAAFAAAMGNRWTVRFSATWGTERMPDGIIEQWERIIREVVAFDFKGEEQPIELTFSLDAHRKLCQWKENVNNAIYSATESEAEKAVCGKLETYLIRFCLIIRIMKNICNEESSSMIDTGSAEAAIELVEYFREMENRVIRISLSGNLDKRQSELLDALPYDFRTSDAIDIGQSLGMSESTVKRFLKNTAIFRKKEHGRYTKMSCDP